MPETPTVHHYVINSSFYCRRTKEDGLIEVLNSDSYLMAKYNERTGTAKWMRVALVAQREFVERWLGEHFPPHA